MSDENIANREYTVETDESVTTMPGSRLAGNGEMGGSMGDSPLFDADNAGSPDSSDSGMAGSNSGSPGSEMSPNTDGGSSSGT